MLTPRRALASLITIGAAISPCLPAVATPPGGAARVPAEFRSASPLASSAASSSSALAASFLRQAGVPARRSQRVTKVPASVILAQAILESSWGRSELAVTDRNYFGIKCSSSGDHGSYATGCRRHPTTECGPRGCRRTTALFRTYRSPADSFKDHGRFLSSSDRYRAAFEHTADPDRFARRIAKAGYATDPGYPVKLIRLMRTYDLYRYDR
ncbi:glucosaminidase domain-containing protein [Planobispora rosea]|uniref:glucosaminidase domain-containing protein n=1 Tax=Planobispora rosea TaxID=35762 RepID=UPI00083A4E33|nr:glucosaminidase domain-containing protein [Planobispora rosea]